jgi:hypothetical protein
MWHLRTRQGTFWVIESQETHKYVLGVNNDELGSYDDADAAAKDVHNQATGYFPWDCQSHAKAPDHVSNWVQGEPDNWSDA